MSLLDDYGIDLEEVEAPNYNVDDDFYEFELSEVFLREGTENYPDRRWVIFRYLVGDTGKSKDEWFQLPEDASDPTTKELQALGFYKARLLSLGVDKGEVNNVNSDDLVGITGTFKLETRKGFQNIYNLKIDEEFVSSETEDGESEEEAERVEEKPKKAPAKAAPSKSPAQKVSTQKAKSAVVRKNPFADKK